MSQTDQFVIIGASLAGAKAAAELRKQAFEGAITLVGTELHHPYERPPLSKDLLQGKADRPSVFVTEADWYVKNQVDLRLGVTASSIDTSAHTATLDTGEHLVYDKLLLATGSSPRRPTIDGSDLDGVHYLRTLDQSESLRAAIEGGGKRVVVIGSGWIGMEVAASARILGNEVTVLSHGEVPLAGAIGIELGRVFAALHADNGVDIRTLADATAIVGDDGRVTGVAVDGADVVPADVVVIGIGAVPRLDLALAAGLESDDGVLVSGSLQTSDPDVYAAGDIASIPLPAVGQRLRSEHWQNAISTGEAAARSMLGQAVSYDEIPYFFTDQFDLGMEYSGYGPLARDARPVIRGDLTERQFVAFWLTEHNRVVAGMNVNVWDVNGEVQRLIRRGTPVDPGAIADSSTPLDSL